MVRPTNRLSEGCDADAATFGFRLLGTPHFLRERERERERGTNGLRRCGIVRERRPRPPPQPPQLSQPPFSPLPIPHFYPRSGSARFRPSTSIHLSFATQGGTKRPPPPPPWRGAAPLVMHADCRKKNERRRRKEGRTTSASAARGRGCGRLFTSSAQQEQKSSLSNVPRERASERGPLFLSKHGFRASERASE